MHDTTIITPRVYGEIKPDVNCPECHIRLGYQENGTLYHALYDVPDGSGVSTCTYAGKTFKTPTIPLEIIEDTKEEKPGACPFCRSPHTSVRNNRELLQPFTVYCEFCLARGPRKTTKDEAISGWRFNLPLCETLAENG